MQPLTTASTADAERQEMQPLTTASTPPTTGVTLAYIDEEDEEKSEDYLE